LRAVVAIRVAVNRPIEPVGVCGLIRSMNCPVVAPAGMTQREQFGGTRRDSVSWS
jgi:hypothetical protein